MKRKIVIYTASRSEYGILKSIIFNLDRSKKCETRVLVSGTHLEKKFGNTIEEIKSDNIKSIIKIKTLKNSTSKKNISYAISEGVIKISKFFENFKPDIVLLVGDRFELIAVATSCLIYNIPIAHIHGGELTYGLIDDYVRHSITKMSTFHFASNKKYRKRIIQMGENKRDVLCTGSPSVDLIKKIEFINKKKLEDLLKINFLEKIFLVTYSPISTNRVQTEIEINNLLKALSAFYHFTIIFTLPNYDIYSDLITKKIELFCKKNKNSYFFKSLGHTNYLSLVKISNLVIGNSSSGILEVPYLKTFTINIGERQLGRIMPKSVFNSSVNVKNIQKLILKILAIRNKSQFFKINLFGNGKASKKIADFLINKKLANYKLGKKFTDINFKL